VGLDSQSGTAVEDLTSPAADVKHPHSGLDLSHRKSLPQPAREMRAFTDDEFFVPFAGTQKVRLIVPVRANRLAILVPQ
jgi:hypothetical protein